MSQKIGVNIGGRRFDVDVEDYFVSFLKEQMARDFNIDGNNDLKTLIHAYVKKSHELYQQEKKIQEILEKLEED